MRHVYEIDGMRFEMRTFTGRDLVRVTGKLAVLPDTIETKNPSNAELILRFDMQDHVLALCSINPRLTLDNPAEIPDGTLPISELPDAVYQELTKRLAADSGYTTEASAEVRPTLATAEPS